MARPSLIPALVMLLAAMSAGPAAAQTQTAPARPPMINAEGLPTVFLTDLQGVEHRGKLVQVAPEQVVLRVDAGERTFKRDEIVRIEKRGDSLKNGALIGAAVGALAGFFSAGLADCPGARDSCGGSRVAFFALAVGTYTAIGTGIDAAIKGRTLLYRAPTATVAATRGGAAIAVTIRW